MQRNILKARGLDALGFFFTNRVNTRPAVMHCLAVLAENSSLRESIDIGGGFEALVQTYMHLKYVLTFLG